MTTFAASLANSIAVARPMPALPPVISATFPSNWFILPPSLRSRATYSHPPRNVDVDFKHRTTDAAFRREHFRQRSAVNGCAALWDIARADLPYMGLREDRRVGDRAARAGWSRTPS